MADPIMFPVVYEDRDYATGVARPTDAAVEIYFKVEDGEQLQYSGLQTFGINTTKPFRGKLVDGVLEKRGGGTLQLVANDPALGLDRLVYTIRFLNADVDGVPVVIDAFDFEAPPDNSQLDLNTVSPVVGSTEGIVRGPEGPPGDWTAAELQAFIDAAVNAVIDGAPGALDTLNELAAALGDDANFAATVTTALAGKQPLDADLTAIAALTSAADKLPYSTGANTWATTNLTSFARTLLDDTDAATMRSTLGVGTGAGDVVGPSASVDGEVAVFDSTTGKLIKRATTSGIPKLTSGVLGTATAGTDYYNPGGTDVAVADGGTGASTASDARTNLGLGSAAVETAATAATANTVAKRGATGSLTAVSLFQSFATTATAAGTTTLTIASSPIQVFTGTTTQTVALPTTSLPQGAQFLIINQSTGAVTVQSSGANTVVILAAGTAAWCTAVVATPTTAANWDARYWGSAIASSKSMTVNNTLTLAGTDGTTMTFPSTSGTVLTADSTATETNKRITPRIGTTASSATPTINSDTVDQFNVTALATNITSMSSGLSGTPTSGQQLIVRIKDDGTSRTITWGASWQAAQGVTLPTSTTASQQLYVEAVWNSTDSKWDVTKAGGSVSSTGTYNAPNPSGDTSGATDVTALNNAITAATAAGRTLVFPDGTYYVNNTVHFTGDFDMTNKTVILAATGCTVVADTPFGTAVSKPRFNGGIFDANDIADKAFWFHNCQQPIWTGQPWFRNAKKADLTVGDPADSQTSGGIRLYDPQFARTVGSAPVGGINLHLTSQATDALVFNSRGNGQECAIFNEGGGNVIVEPHHSNTQLCAYVDASTNGKNSWVGVVADTLKPRDHGSASASSGTSTITDTSIAAIHQGLPVVGTGIPADSYVGTVTAGTSFTLVNKDGTAVNTTGAVSGITLHAVGLLVRCPTSLVLGGHCLSVTGINTNDNACYPFVIGPNATDGQIRIDNYKIHAQSGAKWVTPIAGKKEYARWQSLINDSNVVYTVAPTDRVDPALVGPNYYPPGYLSGEYYFCNSGGAQSTNGALGNQTVLVSAWVVTSPVTVTKLAAEYTVAGNASSVFRIGIWYHDDGTRKPGALLLDAGTIATDGTPALSEVTLSQVLTPGIYWVGGAVQAAATTQPTMRTVTGSTVPAWLPLGTSLPSINTGVSWRLTGVSGAFGSLASATVSATAAPRIVFKTA